MSKVSSGEYPTYSEKQEKNTLGEIIEFLTEMSSQDNRGTAFPYYYTIADEKTRYEDNDKGEYVWCDGNAYEIKDLIRKNDTFDFGDKEDVIEWLGSSCEDEKVEEFLKEEFYSDYFRCNKEYDTYYEGMFLTETDAESYLKRSMNHHFGPNPRTYVKHVSCWSRHTKTMDFFQNIFEFFGVKIPPELYYEKLDKEAECKKNS